VKRKLLEFVIVEKVGVLFKSEGKTAYDGSSIYRNDIIPIRKEMFVKLFAVFEATIS
jgi:hypothetical protein